MLSSEAYDQRTPLPWQVLLSAALLTLIGIVAIARAQQLHDLSTRFDQRQVLWCLAAMLIAAAMSKVNFRIVADWSYGLFAVNLLLLVVVFWLPTINGVHRWIRLGPIGLQPSEFAKITFVLALARYLRYCESQQRLRGLILPFAIAMVPLLLILREPDLGTSLVFPPLLFVMFVAAGARLRDLALATTIGLCLSPVLWSQMSREQRSRVTALAEQTGPGQRPTPDGYQLHQSKQMIALGGMAGSLLGGEVTQDRAVYHLPVAHSDFIFSVIGERLGVWGTTLTLALYGLLVSGMLAVGRKTRDGFGRLVCVGTAALFGVEALVNTGMSIGLAPVTGLSLPLVSYGGSGFLAHAIGLGLVLSVARHPGYDVGPAPFRFGR